MASRGRERTPARSLSLGWDQSSGTADGGPSSAPRRPPTDGRAPGTSRRGRRVLMLGTALLLVLTLVVALPRLVIVSDGPEEVVADVLQSVVDGDLEALQDHLEVTESASGAALSAEVLAGASDGLEDFEIRDVERESGTATVTADLFGGGRSGEGTFTLHAVADGPFSPLHWELEPVRLPELRFDLPVGVQEIEISGVPFPASTVHPPSVPTGSAAAVRLLPGTYEVTVPVESRWLRSPQLRISLPLTLGTPSDLVATVDLELTEDGVGEVEDQFADRIQECAASSSPAPEGCPFSVPGAAQKGDLAGRTGTWTVTDEVQTTLAPGGEYTWMVLGSGAARFTPDGAEPAEAIPVPIRATAFAYIDPVGDLRLTSSSEGSTTFTYCRDPETGEIDGVTVVEDTDDGERRVSCP